jgi:hypothetical protein
LVQNWDKYHHHLHGMYSSLIFACWVLSSNFSKGQKQFFAERKFCSPLVWGTESIRWHQLFWPTPLFLLSTIRAKLEINDIWQANVFQMSAMAICHGCKWGRVFEKLLFLSHIIMYQITGFKFVFWNLHIINLFV